MNTVFASGTPYTLTNTPAKVTFGTLSPSVVLPNNVQRLVCGRVVVDLSNCTLSGPTTITLKLRRTSQTPADFPKTQTTIVVGAIGTSGTNEVDVPVMLPAVIINTPTNAAMTVELWASVDSLPATGAIRIREASLLIQ